ncbi:MAG: 4Fe-4S dicluster domain-containing protein [Chloroflexi bacterium]|nr:4Fe-4S dicluster domain-containing protein [Chloroflexota bacterium]MCH8283244.1 4Fe-4S dicluster domain-containing protein [Chloroflexota bacterium]
MTTNAPLELPGADAPTEADLYKCVHCGLCLQACPTYLELGLETESPRGRLALMKAVHGGRIGLTEGVVGHMELCLQCRACETACPSGVPFGRMMEATRAQITATTRRSLRARAVRFLVFRLLFPRLGLLRAGAWLLKLYQRSGVQWLVRELRVLKPIKSLDQLEQQLPRLPKFYRPPPSELVPAQGQATRRVAMLSGCVMPLVYGPVNEATVRVLARNGCDVLTPRAQGCCGSLHAHSGERDGARALARRNIDVFLETSPDAIIVNAAGCGATMKEYAELLEGDPAYRDKARRFSALVRDVTEFLAELPFEPPKKELSARVTYQDSCHLVHAQGIKNAPREVLRSIPGLRFVEMKASDTCCGAAGVYNVVHRDLANGILDQKMANVAAAQPDIIATANPGCMLQLEMGVRRMGLDARVAHVVELLDEAYG